VLLKRSPKDLTSLQALVYCALVKDGGGAARNCEGLVKVNGATVANHRTNMGAKLGRGPGEVRGRWTPDAWVGTPGKRRRVRWEASIVGPQGDDTGSGLMAHATPGSSSASQ